MISSSDMGSRYREMHVLVDDAVRRRPLATGLAHSGDGGDVVAVGAVGASGRVATRTGVRVLVAAGLRPTRR